jgi:hypothetical protein
LLKKRQSVSYHQAVADGFGLSGGGAVPALPPMPVGMAGVGGGGDGGGGGGGGIQVIKILSPVGRVEGEDQLVATGLDVDQLAGESFRPEECEPFCSVEDAGC